MYINNVHFSHPDICGRLADDLHGDLFPFKYCSHTPDISIALLEAASTEGGMITAVLFLRPVGVRARKREIECDKVREEGVRVRE